MQRVMVRIALRHIKGNRLLSIYLIAILKNEFRSNILLIRFRKFLNVSSIPFSCSNRKFESNDSFIHFVEFLNVQGDILILTHFVEFF